MKHDFSHVQWHHDLMAEKKRNSANKTTEPIRAENRRGEIVKTLEELDSLRGLTADASLAERYIRILGQSRKLASARDALSAVNQEQFKELIAGGRDYFDDLERSSDLDFLRKEAMLSYIAAKMLAQRTEVLDALMGRVIKGLHKMVESSFNGQSLDLLDELRASLDAANDVLTNQKDARSRGGKSRTRGFQADEQKARDWLVVNFDSCKSMRDAARKLLQREIVRSVTEDTAYQWVRLWRAGKPPKNSVN